MIEIETSVSDEDVDFLKEADGLVMLPSVQAKMEETMAVIDAIYKDAKKYSWVIMPAIALQFYFAFFTDQNLLWLLTFVFSTIMLIHQFRSISKARRLMMFVEGIMFVTIQTSKDFAQFKHDVEHKITPDIKMAIRKLRDND